MKTNIYTVKNSKQIVVEYMAKKDLHKASLARKLGMSPQNLWRHFQHEDLGFNLLLQISNVYAHNFFKDLSEEYEAEKRKDIPLMDMILKEPEAQYGAIEALVKKAVREELEKRK
jgi:fructosamine-3-kinase